MAGMDSEKGNKMKLVSCFRGLDCLLLRHSWKFFTEKNIGGLLFLGFYCSIQWRKLLLEVTPEIFGRQKVIGEAYNVLKKRMRKKT